jgi:Holliday junction resolvase RusA-like endonuclease
LQAAARKGRKAPAKGKSKSPMKVKFTIAGEPFGKERPRATIVRGKTRQDDWVNEYTPKDTTAYEKRVKSEYQSQVGSFSFPRGQALDMRVIAYYQIPASETKKIKQYMLDGVIRPTKRPDFDNIGKIVADSLNKIAYYDYAQIADALVRKFYSYNPRVEVIIQPVKLEGSKET